MKAHLSRQQRRALDRAAAGVDHITAEDRRWFEARPDRRHRIRRMTLAEIVSTKAMMGLNPVPAGGARFTLVRKITPNLRLRLFIFGPKGKTGDETSEETAAALWEHHRDRSPDAQQREDAIATVAADQDGLAFRQTEGTG
ncbi:hypothetical protein FV232_28210 [Methylobacterium sp. WL30]|uniref:hypothetical protein n=1 Tax=unclassified Methylobacterium TaxID=2615210 RepID=UPI0011C9EF52|nr:MULTISPECIES: hypothetical protein [unclassified Methylobacterium]TXN40675.1 hypothetical protein FV225_05365 [Methylobacterium sp. WL93]TXN49999.1 hypothetical protein FV227_14050 [Methylobacterium sp. WL119]TXN60292.1 hypothetical protein FV232_28210 [Methylobacterium sp. WL30]